MITAKQQRRAGKKAARRDRLETAAKVAALSGEAAIPVALVDAAAGPIARAEAELGRPITPDLVAAGRRAAAAAETVKAQAVPAAHLDALVDDLVERGAPPDVLDLARYFVGMARRFDVEFSPAMAAASQMAPAMGIDLDVGEIMLERDRIRANIADALRDLFAWQPETEVSA